MIPLLVGLAAWESAWWLRRRAKRTSVFAVARAEATRLGRPLVVIGAPDGGITAGYPCGDVTVDLRSSTCPGAIRADVTQRLPFADDSYVVFCSCVLEYVQDADAAVHEIARIFGGHAFFVGVEPWCMAAYVYPGARRVLHARYR